MRMTWNIKTGRQAQRIARTAGLIGMVVLISGSFAHSVNTELLDYGNARNTLQSLLAAQPLFRLGFVSGLLMQTVFIFYALYLYKLLHPVNNYLAAMMMILVLVPVPLFLLNQLNQFAVLLLAQTHNEAQMLFYLKLHKYGGYIVSVFYGLWLFPLGYLVYKSVFLPRILGILLIIGGFGYLISFIQGFLFPEMQNTLWTNPALLVTHAAELLLVLWLLIAGLSRDKWNRKMIERNT